MRWRWIAALLALVLFVGACSSDDKDEAERDEDTSTEETSEEADSTTTTGGEVAGVPAELADEVSAAADVETATYVGSVEGGPSYVGLIVSDSEVRVYVCDGETVSEWSSATVEGDAIEGEKVSATISEDSVSGTVTVDGSDLAFSAERAELPAGLYESRGYDAELVGTHGGWIVLADGSQKGLATREGSVVTTSTLDTSTSTAQVDGSTSTAPPSGGEVATDLTVKQCNGLKSTWTKIWDQYYAVKGTTAAANDVRDDLQAQAESTLRTYNNGGCFPKTGNIDPIFG